MCSSDLCIQRDEKVGEVAAVAQITLQSLLYLQRELRNSGDFPNFFVPLNAFTPRQYRLQEQIIFSF